MPLLALAAGAVASSCGSSTPLSSLAVTTQVIAHGTPAKSAPVAQGTSAQVQVTVTNIGTGALRGVTIRLEVPTGFIYTNTVSVVQNGDAVRAADIAPVSREATLTWGAWTIGPGAPGQPSQVIVTANLLANGGVGQSRLAPEVFATGYSSFLTGAEATLEITAAPSLNLALRVSPAAVAAGSLITYHAVITNTGSGAAPGVNLGITLPANFDYRATLSTSGNTSTSGTTYPISGSVMPIWSGFEIPGQGSGGPGILSLTFQVMVLPDVPRGIYQATATLVASNGSTTQDQIQLNYAALAPVEVTGPGPAPSNG
ncbi:MAG: COG1361 family protein [Candidatus Dormibacteria bacterium]